MSPANCFREGSLNKTTCLLHKFQIHTPLNISRKMNRDPLSMPELLFLFLSYKGSPYNDFSLLVKLLSLDKSPDGRYRPWVLIPPVALNRYEQVGKTLVFLESPIPHL